MFGREVVFGEVWPWGTMHPGNIRCIHFHFGIKSQHMTHSLFFWCKEIVFCPLVVDSSLVCTYIYSLKKARINVQCMHVKPKKYSFTNVLILTFK